MIVPPHSKIRLKPRLRRRLRWTLLLGLVIFTTTTISPASAQLSNSNSGSKTVKDWVRLDGNKVVTITAPQAAISKRREQVEEKLEQISSDYIQQETSEVTVAAIKQTDNNLPEIYVNGFYLMTITPEDAKLQGTTPWDIVKELEESIPEALKQAKQERHHEYLAQQIKKAVAIALGIVVVSVVIGTAQRYSHLRWTAIKTLTPQSISDKLTQQQQENLQAIEHHLLQLAQCATWIGGPVLILGLFSYTRPLQVAIISGLQIPLLVGVVIFVAYVGTRLSYVLIDRFVSNIAQSNFIEEQDSRRLELRINTVSSVLRRIARLACILIGILVALSVSGISFASILAGFGVVGLVVTLGSQNLIKGAINSFFIILEDQYAIGDVIVLESLNQIGGLVENMDLRITQLRDADGRLITVPNSEIKAAANLSYRWARSDILIPVSYDANINQALQLINKVAQEMNEEPEWKELILEEPQLLGIDKFGERGLVVRLWIKVKPLKQWDVSREYRRRLKLAFDDAEMGIPVPQQQIRFNPSLPMKTEMDGDQKPHSTQKSNQADALTNQMENLLAGLANSADRKNPSSIRMKDEEKSSEDTDQENDD